MIAPFYIRRRGVDDNKGLGGIGATASPQPALALRVEPIYVVSTLTGIDQAQEESMTWLPIETIPEEMRDGREVRVRRMSPSNPDAVVAEGLAVFGEPHAGSPMRQGIGPDPLGRMTAADYSREAEERERFIAEKRWLNPDRMHCFPTPTHWQNSDA
jgi:hypothetical protein